LILKIKKKGTAIFNNLPKTREFREIKPRFSFSYCGFSDHIQNNVPESFRNANSFTSAEGYATNKKSGKQAHRVGSLLGFYPLEWISLCLGSQCFVIGYYSG
jgi:hypothetical protein